MKKRYIPVLLSIALSSVVSAKVADFSQVIPLPDSIEIKQSGTPFVIDKNTLIFSDDANKENAMMLRSYLQKLTGYALSLTNHLPKKNGIILKTSIAVDNPEGYIISVNKNLLEIESSTPAGIFYGIQSIRKSVSAASPEEIQIPEGRVIDSPRFGYRGVMLDVSRHFFTKKEVKKFIEMLTLHNINRFHWHLSDDQGWRIEIKSHPELTEKASVRPETVIGHNTPNYDGTPHGGYYTQDDIREIVEFAERHHITIIPEIDLPGHMQAALTAYPNLGCRGDKYELWKIWGVSEEVLCAGNPDTYTFLEDVLGEVADLFPGEIFHIGGDECPKTRWHDCPKCQAKIKELGIEPKDGRTAEQQLQSHVMEFAQNFLAGKGKRVLGWDEMLEGGINNEAIIMSWRGLKGGIDAAKIGNDVVMAPTYYMYFDYFQTSDVENEPDAQGGYVPIEKVYSFNPYPEQLSGDEASHIIGVQACLWTAYLPTLKSVEYMALPRMAALSEVQWCTPEKQDYTRFTAALPGMLEHYFSNGYNYSNRLFDVASAVIPVNEQRKTLVSLSSINNAPVHYTLDGSDPSETSPVYSDPIELNESATIKARAYHDGHGFGNMLTETVYIHKGCYNKITLLTEPHPDWKAGGAESLIDGLHGNANRESGRWMGFRDNDMVALIEFPEETELSRLKVASCMNKNEWSFHIASIKLEISDDGENFVEVGTMNYPHITHDMPDGVRNHSLKFAPRKARYARVTVAPDREPEGYKVHGPGYVFIDEIVLN